MKDSQIQFHYLFYAKKYSIVHSTGINKPWNGKVAKRKPLKFIFTPNEQRVDTPATVFNACCTKILSLVFHNTENVQ